MTDQKLLDRFWAKVDKSPGLGRYGNCWLWTSQLRGGYGIFRHYSKVVSAHRFAYGLESVLDNALQVRHRCDTPACVRPGHLLQGTAKMNSDDKFSRGRGQGLLDDEQVKEIRALPLTDTILKEVSAQFGVSEQWARNALDGRTYQHLPNARVLPRQKSKRKLDDSIISAIKKELVSPYWGQQSILANKYHTSRTTIQRIANGTY